MRTVLILILSLAACIQRTPQAPVQPAPVAQPAPKPVAPPAPPAPAKNLVCEAWQGVNAKAACTPYLTTDTMHTAMIAIDGQQLHCAYTAKGVECHAPIVIVQQPAPPVEDKEPAKAKK